VTSTSVVILNYNGEKYLEQFLPAVVANSKSAKIVVADNQSNDGSLALLRRSFPEVEVIELERNYGYSGGYNRTISQLDSEFVVLLNSDVLVTVGWLNPLIGFLKDNPEYASCQPKIKDYNSENFFEYAGASGGFIDFMGYPYCRGRIFDNIEIDQGQYDEAIDVFWATGACLAIRRKVFLEAGGLDPDFFAHMEEIDLCWRTRSMGYKTRAIPKSTVYHVGGGTLSKLSPTKTYLNFRNGLSMLIKNLPVTELAVKVPARILLDWVAAIKFILEGNWRHGVSVFKAHLRSVVILGKNIRKRKYTSSLSGNPHLVWGYYIKGKKTYKDLFSK
ncbi:MAG: glycosyltransferase family 2 protein, partial [Bacteroidota bacterium]